jgi:hypothetical protein
VYSRSTVCTVEEAVCNFNRPLSTKSAAFRAEKKDEEASFGERGVLERCDFDVLSTRKQATNRAVADGEVTAHVDFQLLPVGQSSLLTLEQAGSSVPSLLWDGWHAELGQGLHRAITSDFDRPWSLNEEPTVKRAGLIGGASNG